MTSPPLTPAPDTSPSFNGHLPYNPHFEVPASRSLNPYKVVPPQLEVDSKKVYELVRYHDITS